MKAVLEIEMPESCASCKLSRYEEFEPWSGTVWCPHINKYVCKHAYKNAEKERHPDCPLKPIEQ